MPIFQFLDQRQPQIEKPTFNNTCDNAEIVAGRVLDDLRLLQVDISEKKCGEKGIMCGKIDKNS